MAAEDPFAFHTECEVYCAGKKEGEGGGRREERGGGVAGKVPPLEPVEQPFYLRAVVNTERTTRLPPI